MTTLTKMKLAIYKFVFQLYKVYLWLSLGEDFKVHYRNSLLFGDIRFLQSDIDISVVFKGKDPIKGAKLFLQRHRLFKTFFPIIGEINFYFEPLLKLQGQVSNLYEMQRDPKTLALCSPSSPQNFLQFEKLVFLLRTLRIDYVNLRDRPQKRVHKWKYILRICQIEFPRELTLESILKIVSQQIHLCGLPEGYQAALKSAFCEFLALKKSNLQLYQISQMMFNSEAQWIFFADVFCFSKEVPTLKSEAELNLVDCLLRWELSASLNQGFFEIGFLDHLKNIDAFWNSMKSAAKLQTPLNDEFMPLLTKVSEQLRSLYFPKPK